MRPNYYVFQYEQYYPEGGMNDSKGPYETLREAQREAVSTLPYNSYTEIWRVDNNKIEWECTWMGTGWEYRDDDDRI